MPKCSLSLQPSLWEQSVEHYTGINVEGRRFCARCAVAQGSELRLSNEILLERLSVEILIFETSRMQHELAELPQAALGSLTFYPSRPAHDGIPAIEAFMAGWFVLNEQSLEDAWNQVLFGAGYSKCTISLRIGPVDLAPPESWLWDVTRNPNLTIDSVSIGFARPAPQMPTREKEKHRGFWRPG
jgi:hypothetical protein